MKILKQLSKTISKLTLILFFCTFSFANEPIDIWKIEKIVVDSEMDALLLENNLIKKYQPKYNILLKDDKSYPWVCIVKEPIPNIFYTRKIENRRGEYYGPFTNVYSARFLIKLIKDIYPFLNHELNHLIKKETEETIKIKDEFEAAFNAQNKDAAKIIIDFWGGDGSFASMPHPVQQYCRQTAYNNVLDWYTALSFRAKADDYAKLSMPVLLVRGAHANTQMVQITKTLQSCIPNQRSVIISNAAHFLITSHAAECAHVLVDFLNRCNIQ